MNRLIDKINNTIEQVSLEAFDKVYSYKLLYFYKGKSEVIKTMKSEAKDKLAHVLAHIGQGINRIYLQIKVKCWPAYTEKK